MRKAMFLILFLAAWAVMSSAASAGLVTDLLALQNSVDDPIQDRSYGFVLDTGAAAVPSAGDIGWGLIRVDRINNIEAQNRVYMVYAAQVSGFSANPILDDQNNVLGYSVSISHTFVDPNSAWDLKDLLSGVGNAASIEDRALVALIEAPSSVAFDVSFDAAGDFSKTPSELKNEIQTRLATASVLATFGLAANSDDFYRLSGEASSLPPGVGTVFTQFADMSLVNNFVGPATQFLTLFMDPTADATIRLGALEQLTSWGANKDDGLDFVRARDNGTYYVNAVPEPTSMIGLLGLGLAGSALALVHRRARKS